MNEQGKVFLESIREIYKDTSDLKSPARAARVTAFAICCMLDGSGEHDGQQYQVLTAEGKPVKFFHHDL